MNDATLDNAGPKATIRLERVLHHSPAEVWRSITESDELDAWFPCRIEVESWTPGASMRFRFDKHDVDLDGEVLEVDEPRLLVYRWGDDMLRFELHPHDAGTMLVLCDTLDAAFAARNSAGWEECLSRLTGDDFPGWKVRFDLYAERFAAVAGPQEGPPAEFTEHAG